MNPRDARPAPAAGPAPGRHRVRPVRHRVLSLEPGHWTAPTDCPAWDVRQMAAHMLGMVEMAASMRENLRQQRLARRAVGQAGGSISTPSPSFRWTSGQAGPADRISGRYRARAPKAVTGRRRAPSFVRRRTMPQLQDVNGAQEPWTFGYLIDIILTRDPWMHRLDISRATGTPLQLTADHDGVIVADVVAEWSDRHGKDFALTLTGPAGGTWTVGQNGPALTWTPSTSAAPWPGVRPRHPR